MDSFFPMQTYTIGIIIFDDKDVATEMGPGTIFTTAPIFGKIEHESTETEIIFRWNPVENSQKFMYRYAF